jgi:predicted DNA-binding transcriptional regulator YafY
MAAERVQRLLRLITLLQSRQARGVADILNELGVGRRTLFRDLKLLQQAGIPAIYERGAGYRIAGSFFLPPVNLTVAETLGLMLLGKSAAVRKASPLMGPAWTAVTKLVAILPAPLRSACDDSMARVSVSLGPELALDTESGHYGVLQRCIHEGRACRVVYKGPTEPEFQTRFDPHTLHFATRAWYVLGHSELHAEVRVLKVVRIRELEPLKIRFDKPKRSCTEDKLGRSWQFIPEGRVYDVVLEFTPKVAVNVSEVCWHPSQTHTPLPGGGCRLRFQVDGVGEIAWWICGYAGEVKVLRPPELRRRVDSMLAEALARYTGEEA